jgi:hypothetical protein
MFAFIFAFALALLLVAAALTFVAPREQRPVAILLVVGYVSRLVAQLFSRGLHIFSSEGADYGVYANHGEVIARLWEYSGIHYVTTDELPLLNRVTFPPNLLAVVFYLNGEPTRLGGTAVLAAVACLTCLEVYTLAIELGAAPSTALKTTGFLLFMPTFFYYTSDMFKDGLVCLGVILVLGSSIRLARRFSVVQLGAGLLGLACVWGTRYYVAYMLPAPLTIGWLGARAMSLRGVVAALILAVSVTSVVSYTSAAGNAAEDAATTWERGTSTEALQGNLEAGGSGVNFDDGGSRYGSLPIKMIYTLFSPFPWQSGSLGLQLGKLEVLVWYFLAYRAAVAMKIMWRKNRVNLAIFLSFILPTTVVYAVSFTNIGLNIRERLGIVMAAALLATVSWSVPADKPGRALVSAPGAADS